jgi:hypothetical protein
LPVLACSFIQLEKIFQSVGWQLTKAELERIRQTFDTGDATLGEVACGEFIAVLCEATTSSVHHGEKYQFYSSEVKDGEQTKTTKD